MPDIKFSYLYRDGANYKNHSFVIFANPTNADLFELETLIHSKLINDTWFYVNQWELPDLHFGTWDNEIDHTWHEFESVEHSEETANSQFLLLEFIEVIAGVKF
ncbi:hypothetical protein [Mucilaginibacter sp.]|jgi:hypothetical protein|uniref:hypothetical protein n=1 Tax=Mucilaginibacter sp. TaxID=1882438 RepID=UPI0035665067